MTGRIVIYTIAGLYLWFCARLFWEGWKLRGK